MNGRQSRGSGRAHGLGRLGDARAGPRGRWARLRTLGRSAALRFTGGLLTSASSGPRQGSALPLTSRVTLARSLWLPLVSVSPSVLGGRLGPWLTAVAKAKMREAGSKLGPQCWYKGPLGSRVLASHGASRAAVPSRGAAAVRLGAALSLGAGLGAVRLIAGPARFVQGPDGSCGRARTRQRGEREAAPGLFVFPVVGSVASGLY